MSGNNDAKNVLEIIYGKNNNENDEGYMSYAKKSQLRNKQFFEEYEKKQKLLGNKEDTEKKEDFTKAKRKSSEYLKLNNQKDDELEEEEEEVEDNYNEDIPKPFFFNSKLEKKINENEDNSTDTDKSEDNEDKNFNEVNYWHIDTKNEDMEELLKDL